MNDEEKYKQGYADGYKNMPAASIDPDYQEGWRFARGVLAEEQYTRNKDAGTIYTSARPVPQSYNDPGSWNGA